jgi:hypothetical protein
MPAFRRAQLYNMVREMISRLKSFVENGCSTPGAAQPNDAEIDIWKLDSTPGIDISRWDDY